MTRMRMPDSVGQSHTEAEELIEDLRRGREIAPTGAVSFVNYYSQSFIYNNSTNIYYNSTTNDTIFYNSTTEINLYYYGTSASGPNGVADGSVYFQYTTA